MGGNHFRKASESGVLKKCMNGGNFIAVVGDDPKPVIKSVWSMLKLFFIILGRPIWTLMIFWIVPKYTAFVCLPDAKMLRRPTLNLPQKVSRKHFSCKSLV